MIKERNSTIALCFVALLPMVARAQPETAPKPNPEPPVRNQDGNPPKTPVEIEADQKQRRQARLKFFMNAAGISEPATQTDILDFAEQQQVAQKEIQNIYFGLARTLVATAAPERRADGDRPVADGLLDLRQKVAAERTRRVAAEATLEAKLHFRAAPRLEAFLDMTGLIGEDPFYAFGMAGPNGAGNGRFRGGRPQDGGAAPANPPGPPQPPPKD